MSTSIEAAIGLKAETKHLVDEFIGQFEEISRVLQDRPWMRNFLYRLAEFHMPTFIHSIQVGRAAHDMGLKIRDRGYISSSINVEPFTDEDVDTLTLAGIFHDHGKTFTGDFGRRILNSTEEYGPYSPERLHMRIHVPKGFELIRVGAKTRGDMTALRAAYTLARHHEFQVNSHGVDNLAENAEIDNINLGDQKLFHMSRILAACDQSVAIAMAADGGHSFIVLKRANYQSSRAMVEDMLLTDRSGIKTGVFNDISKDVMDSLQATGILVER